MNTFITRCRGASLCLFAAFLTGAMCFSTGAQAQSLSCPSGNVTVRISINASGQNGSASPSVRISGSTASIGSANGGSNNVLLCNISTSGSATVQTSANNGNCAASFPNNANVTISSNGFTTGFLGNGAASSRGASLSSQSGSGSAKRCTYNVFVSGIGLSRENRERFTRASGSTFSNPSSTGNNNNNNNNNNAGKLTNSQVQQKYQSCRNYCSSKASDKAGCNRYCDRGNNTCNAQRTKAACSY